MRQSLAQLSLLLAVLCACADVLASSGGKVTYATEILFGVASPVVPRADRLVDVFACRAKETHLESVLMTGYADQGEKDAQKLSEKRAQRVRKLLIQLGLPASKIHVDGKGVSHSASKEESSLNRRVRIEFSGYGSARPPEDCEAVSNGFALALTPAAFNGARAQVRRGQMVARDPAATAIAAKRLDLLDLVLAGNGAIPLNTEDRSALMRMAILGGDVRFVERLITYGIVPDDLEQPGITLVWAVCDTDQAGSNEAEPTRVTDLLLRWGARPMASTLPKLSERNPLLCAARRNYLTVLRLLIAADPHSDMVAKLGISMAYSSRFNEPADVQRFVDLGFDINKAGDDGFTPLHFALRYASADVLEQFVKLGAVLGPSKQSWVTDAIGNVPALVWAIDKGAILEGNPEIAHVMARQGAGAVPVMDALHRRGVDLRRPDRVGSTPLTIAIDGLSLELVQCLLRLGVLTEPEEIRSAQVYASRRPVVEAIYPCPHCPPSWYHEQAQTVNSPQALASRQRRKEQIVRLLSSSKPADGSQAGTNNQ